MDEEDEDEDEETLQLRLQQIQAKLKLKKLQNAARKSADSDQVDGKQDRHAQRPRSPQKRPHTERLSPTRLYQAAVEVPISPVRNPRETQELLSPARQRLGLSAFQRSEHVSLKRARDGTQIKRTKSQSSAAAVSTKTTSFSERLKQSKHDIEEKQAKQDRIEKVRSSGFTHSGTKSSSQNGKWEPTSFDRGPSSTNGGRDRPLSAGRAVLTELTSCENSLSRSASTSAIQGKDYRKSGDKPRFNPGAYGQQSGTGHAGDESDSSLQNEHAKQDDESGYDPFSKTHLSKRHIQHSVIAREMEGKEVYTLPRLLKEVKAPDYDPPDCESDFVVFAVLASKSNPLEHAQTHKTAEQTKEDYDAPRNKFMVLHFCDLKWEIDCFLFGTAFNQFWKLTPGSLLAILNPAILPPKGNQNNGRFSLKLGSSEDAVMEIGVARDLGYCSATKKDGQPCGEWIDKRRTEACEFHLSLQIEKSRKGRMEVNSMFRGAGNPDDKIKSHVVKEKRGKAHGSGKYHRDYGQIWSVNTGMKQSTASLLDADNTDSLSNLTQEELSRKRIANAQKERDLAKRLGDMGRGVGAEYMRSRHAHTTSTTTSSTTTTRQDSAADDARNALFSKPLAADLGLLGKKASDVHLSPSKDRKKHFGLGAASLSNTSSDPMGWGGARKAGLLQPKDNRLGSPERGQKKLSTECVMRKDSTQARSQDSSMRSNGSSSPVKKKARFNLAKGIREPGRDSLPAAAALNDDDDDLDIV